MTTKEKRFYLPYLPSNQKRAAKSPPTVTFQKQSSRESMLLKTTEMEFETPTKSYNGKLQRYIASHTITKAIPQKDEQLSSRGENGAQLDST